MSSYEKFQGQIGQISGAVGDGPRFQCRTRNGDFCYKEHGCDCLVDPESFLGTGFFSGKKKYYLFEFLLILLFVCFCIATTKTT